MAEVHVLLASLTRFPAGMALHLSPCLALPFCSRGLTHLLCQKPSSVLLTEESAMVTKDAFE